MNIASLASVAGRVTTKLAFESASKRLDGRYAEASKPPTLAKATETPKEACCPAPENKAHGRGPMHRDMGMEAFKKSFGSTKGDVGYRAEFDLDKDGEIGAGDFGILSTVKGMDQPAFTLEEFQKAFGTAKGDEGYDARFDLDSDGEIGPGDFGIYSEKNAGRSLGSFAIEKFKEANYSVKGDKNFNANFDFDADGKINESDLETLSSALGVLYG